MCPRNRDKSSMHGLAYWAEELEVREAKERGSSREDARPFLASKLKMLPGTLENIFRGRIKEPKQKTIDAVRNAFIRELEAEIQRLEHEVFMARQSGAAPDAHEIFEAQSHIEAAKSLLGKK